MAENAKIAALRAASPAAPQGPSGPQALVYPWMQAQGRELIVPDRTQIAQQPPSAGKSRPPPDASGGLIAPIRDSNFPTDPNTPMSDFARRKSALPPDVPQEPAYSPQPGQFEAFSEPVYFDPGQFSYVPEPPAAPAPATETAPQEPYAPIEWQPNFFVEGYTGDALVAAPAPAPAPAPSPDLAMYDPALLELLQQQQQLQDPMAQMQMAYSDPYSRMGGRFFDV